MVKLNSEMKAGIDAATVTDVQVNHVSQTIAKPPVICSFCGGYGYTIEVEAECCGNYKEYGCCGVPNPVQVQVECKCDKGFVPQNCI